MEGWSIGVKQFPNRNTSQMVNSQALQLWISLPAQKWHLVYTDFQNAVRQGISSSPVVEAGFGLPTATANSSLKGRFLKRKGLDN